MLFLLNSSISRTNCNNIKSSPIKIVKIHICLKVWIFYCFALLDENVFLEVGLLYRKRRTFRWSIRRLLRHCAQVGIFLHWKSSLLRLQINIYDCFISIGMCLSMSWLEMQKPDHRLVKIFNFCPLKFFENVFYIILL